MRSWLCLIGHDRARVMEVVAILDLFEVAKDVLAPLGYEVLEVQAGRSARTTVLVRIDRLDEQPVSVADLEKASKVLGLELDHLDPYPAGFVLDIESPGAKRPLLRARHFERMLGLKAKIKRQGGSVIGVIEAVGEEHVRVKTETGEVLEIELAGIRAHLAEFPSEHR